KELRRFFFALNAGIAGCLLCLAAPLRSAPGDRSRSGEWPGGVAPALAFWGAVVAILLVVAYVAALYVPGGRKARGLLGMATSAALLATAADGWQLGREAALGWIFSAEALAASALLGSVIVAMILGHWYLVRWRLSVGHLLKFSVILGGAIVLRALLCLV